MNTLFDYIMKIMNFYKDLKNKSNRNRYISYLYYVNIEILVNTKKKKRQKNPMIVVREV